MKPKWRVEHPWSLALAVLCCTGPAFAQVGTNTFVNWETAPVHPVALSPGGNVLAVCNLPDNRVELFDVAAGAMRPLGSVMAGLDPVSVRFRTEDEVWVVNAISDSISVITVSGLRVKNTLTTRDEPADVVFAGTPARAFVSCAGANQIEVFDSASGAVLTQLPIEGQRPRALAVSPDGAKVYTAIFLSGNRSTILGAGISQGIPAPTVVDFAQGPHRGENPPSNAGEHFQPPLSTNWPAGTKPPRVGLIVRKDPGGRWRDDTEADWTEFVSGTNAVFSGRPAGWDVADHDLAVVDTATLQLRYITGLMNICMDVAVNPATGQPVVIGTDASNERRYEPQLKSRFVQVTLAFVDLSASGRQTASVIDLNPHLDDAGTYLPAAIRASSVGDPRALVWSADGQRGYVAGMGSDNLLLIVADGRRLAPPLPLDAGPAGLALDDARGRLYVFNRFAATISVVDTTAFHVTQTVRLFDPTPQVIKAGRKHFYDTHLHSGLGQASCASCHIDGQTDGLAWDLGNPQGDMKHITSLSHNFARFAPAVTNDFHPMKGPMVTQTLQDIIGHEPFHWRGDRLGLEEFNQTFRNLQGTDAELAPSEMREFKAFLATIAFPPNPFRNLDNTLSTNLPLPGHFALGHGALPIGAPLPNGNAEAGLAVFRETGGPLDCINCHTLPTGLGPDMRFLNGRWAPVALGPHGEHHAALIALDRSSQLPFKIPQLRSVYRKVGADFLHLSSQAGFGFLHDGSVDSLTRFVQDGFDIRADQDTADVIAFLLSFAGSDLPPGSATDEGRAPGLPGRDVPAGVGRQLTIHDSAPAPLLDQFIALARNSTSRVDLIVKGPKDGVPRGWFYDRSLRVFQSDRDGESLEADALRGLASSGNELTYTLVPRGSGRRLGIDRDDDGFLDRSEAESGSDPANPRSVPNNTAPELAAIPDRIIGQGELLSFTAAAKDSDGAVQSLTFRLEPGSPAGAEIDALTGEFRWVPAASQAPGVYFITVTATDNGTPALAASTSFKVSVSDPAFRVEVDPGGVAGGVRLQWKSVAGKTYRIDLAESLDQLVWMTASPNLLADNSGVTTATVQALPGQTVYYRVVLVE